MVKLKYWNVLRVGWGPGREERPGLQPGHRGVDRCEHQPDDHVGAHGAKDALQRHGGPSSGPAAGSRPTVRSRMSAVHMFAMPRPILVAWPSREPDRGRRADQSDAHDQVHGPLVRPWDVRNASSSVTMNSRLSKPPAYLAGGERRYHIAARPAGAAAAHNGRRASPAGDAGERRAHRCARPRLLIAGRTRGPPGCAPGNRGLPHSPVPPFASLRVGGAAPGRSLSVGGAAPVRRHPSGVIQPWPIRREHVNTTIPCGWRARSAFKRVSRGSHTALRGAPTIGDREESDHDHRCSRR